MAKLLLTFCCAILLASVCEATRYDGYSVFRVNFYTVDQFNMLYKLDLRTDKDFSFWQLSRAEHFADIMVAPHATENLLAFLDYYRFTYKLLIEDVQKTIDNGF